MHRIDVHHHILPPEYVTAVGPTKIGAPSSSGRMPEWSAARSLDAMDQNGIATAITSISSPGLALDDLGQRAHLACRCNDFAASLNADHPGRFGMFAALPLPDIDATLREIERAHTDLSAHGFCMMTNYAGMYPGDPKFTPIWEELNRRGAVVFFHPTSPTCAACIADVSASTLEFPFDTTRAITSLLFAGALSRYTQVRFIFAHAGGTMPFLTGRLAGLAQNNPKLAERMPNGVVAELRRLHFDTALSTNAFAFRSLLELVPADQVLFGTDFPFANPARVAATVKGLGALDLPAGDLRKIEHDNALRIIERLSTL